MFRQKTKITCLRLFRDRPTRVFATVPLGDSACHQSWGRESAGRESCAVDNLPRRSAPTPPCTRRDSGESWAAAKLFPQNWGRRLSAGGTVAKASQVGGGEERRGRNSRENHNSQGCKFLDSSPLRAGERFSTREGGFLNSRRGLSVQRLHKSGRGLSVQRLHKSGR